MLMTGTILPIGVASAGGYGSAPLIYPCTIPHFVFFHDNQADPCTVLVDLKALGFGAIRFGLVALYADDWNNTPDRCCKCGRMWLCQSWEHQKFWYAHMLLVSTLLIYG